MPVGMATQWDFLRSEMIDRTRPRSIEATESAIVMIETSTRLPIGSEVETQTPNSRSVRVKMRMMRRKRKKSIVVEVDEPSRRTLEHSTQKQLVTRSRSNMLRTRMLLLFQDGLDRAVVERVERFDWRGALHVSDGVRNEQ